ncbi:DCC1-like thiol-disulfide oxidoreductase family protein [Epilithonimonas sp.]|uniref:thiol-disulfide oxidoreductase DCC family protein n=1 Tax=Epilithonimonas sp. TaxID=2894511 RepID=UPI00289C063B|nr:DCC1-like thiol-disulfide oxidoreductase family protein [Epilithonimonas sp.]
MNNYNNVVLYDGDCGFCNFWVQWILNNDSHDRFKFASLQSEYGQNFLKNQELPTDTFDTLYFIKDGMYYKKMYAVIKIGETLGGVYYGLFSLKVLPKFILNKMYDTVADNRKKLAGESCLLPTPEQRKKFIN